MATELEGNLPLQRFIELLAELNHQAAEMIRSGHMEIDIIAANFTTVAFVEVKTRTYTKETLDTAPPPGNAVKSEKQRLTRKAAKDYLWQHPTKKNPRMDVIEVWLMRDENTEKTKVAKINHIKAAY